MNISPTTSSRRRLIVLLALGCVAAVSGAGLGVVLATWPQAGRADTSRALSAPEAERLAAMRVTNRRDGVVRLRADLGAPDSAVSARLAGWVDWGRGLIYLTVDGSGPGIQPGLLQAAPGVLASRPAPTPAGPTATINEMPPTSPPPDGWRVRRMAAGGLRPAPVDSLVELLLALTTDRPDPVGPLRTDGTRWLGRETVDGVDTDVLRPGATRPSVTAGTPVSGTAPASPVPAGATASAPPGSTRPGTAATSATADKPVASTGSIRYWIDEQARLRRLAAVVADDVPVQIHLDRTGPAPEPVAIDALGGRPVRPRPVDGSETDLLSSMREATRARGGARISLAVPTVPTDDLPGPNLRAGGWVNWYQKVAYLAVRDLDRTAGTVLVRADTDGVATRTAPANPSGRTPRRDGAMPPVPPPDERNWTQQDWLRRADAYGGLDLDLLVNEVLSVGNTGRGNTGRGGSRRGDEGWPGSDRRGPAVWLRTDDLAGRQVTVFEIPRSAEAGTSPGQARLRYWVDRSGVLRRLELRTRIGAFAQLDLVPGSPPYLASVPTA